jgi:hypothetical protein
VVRDPERRPGGTFNSDRHDRPAVCGKGRSAVREKGDVVSVYRDVRVSAVKRSGLAPAMLHKRSIPAVRIPDEKTNLSASRSRRAALTLRLERGQSARLQGPGKVEICPVVPRTRWPRSQVAGSSRVASRERARRPTRTFHYLPGHWGPVDT